ncbi:EthD domain-containing protein [Modicisalibacter muralis]|uniref:EthD domain-containing protein n=1 Tax=Modicisalibacter muralis TaxID=119000 RepID=A0A1G9LMA3_9GAMM|nr:EthD domain-containing protein [Halomonas muralis]SDL63070.1 EthD domain-containing protein [Halomonas muralis]
MNDLQGSPRLIRFGLSPRISRLSPLAAQTYWAGRHADLFSRVPDLSSYVQNHAVLEANEQPILGETGFDIFSEVEFASQMAMSAATTSKYYQDVILADERCLLDASRRAFILVARRGTGSTGLPSGATKLVQFLSNHRPAMTEAGDAPTAYWEDIVVNVSGWHGVQPSVIRQTPYPSVEEALVAHRQGGDEAALLSVIVRQSVVVEPKMGGGLGNSLETV